MIFLLSKEATKPPQSIILLAFSETHSWSSTVRAVSVILWNLRWPVLTNSEDSPLGAVEMPTSFWVASSSTISSCYQRCLKASPRAHSYVEGRGRSLHIFHCHIFHWPWCSFLKKSQIQPQLYQVLVPCPLTYCLLWCHQHSVNSIIISRHQMKKPRMREVRDLNLRLS